VALKAVLALVVAGTPEGVVASGSHTGVALKAVLARVA
jgi:hypothetical protein